MVLPYGSKAGDGFFSMASEGVRIWAAVVATNMTSAAEFGGSARCEIETTFSSLQINADSATKQCILQFRGQDSDYTIHKNISEDPFKCSAH